MSIKIDIESPNFLTRNKKDGSGVYYQQEAFAHVVDRNGNPERYPVKIILMIPKDQSGNAMPYQLGEYSIHPTSFRVNQYGQLELGYLSLRPIPPKK